MDGSVTSILVVNDPNHPDTVSSVVRELVAKGYDVQLVDNVPAGVLDPSPNLSLMDHVGTAKPVVYGPDQGKGKGDRLRRKKDRGW
ncbi:hypothetical protein FQZ97_1154700 [compost metagenome]